MYNVDITTDHADLNTKYAYVINVNKWIRVIADLTEPNLSFS